MPHIPHDVLDHVRTILATAVDQVERSVAYGWDPAEYHAEWDVDDDGVPRNPWTRTTKMPLKDPATGEEFIYATSSRGGIGAVGRLVSIVRRGQRNGKAGLPVVRLDVDDYKHKQYGKVFVPQFTLVGFKSEAELAGGEPDLDAELNDKIPGF